MEEGYLLAKYIPNSFKEVEAYSRGPVRVYRHKPSGCPIATIVGGHQGVIMGAIIYFREENDSMNIEAETPMNMVADTMKYLEKTLPHTKPRDTLDGLWARFLVNFFNTLQQKRGFTADGSPTQLFGVKREAPTRAAENNNNDRGEVEKQEEEDNHTECMICLDRAPDTIVTPCMHRVVCRECSNDLESTADAKICCQCRQPIRGVYYPDNSIKKIE
jgi:hypothetical protein